MNVHSHGKKLQFSIQERKTTVVGWTKILLLAGFSTTVGGSLSVGYNIGVVNAPAVVIKPFCNQSIYDRYGVVLSGSQLDFLWSSIVSIFLIGGAIGSLGGSAIADSLGRRGGLIVSQLLGFIAGLLFVSSEVLRSVETLMVGRLLVGLSAGMITGIMPMYLMEMAPLHLKGSMGVLCPLGVCTGVLLGQIISLPGILGNEHYWNYCLSFFLIPLVLCSIIFPFLPESPKYLFIIKKNHQLAVKGLSRIRNVSASQLEQEIQELKDEQQVKDSLRDDVWSLGRVLKDRKLLLPIMLVCALQSGQQFSGINAVFYYSVAIFKSAGLSESGQQLGTIAAGVCNLFMAIISIRIMEKFNRRFIIQLSLATTAFFLFLLAVAVQFLHAATWMPYLSIVGVLGFVLCYGIGLGPIPYFIASELFEVGPRPCAMALGSMANWGGNFFIGLFFPLMNRYLGAVSFVIFSTWIVFLFFLVRIYLPETRGKDVAQVALLCQDGLASKPLSSPVIRTPE
ncbi:solute carrier family 2, facilitated glucose transporter member 1-like isoform X2 [Coccinella septempunctata]|uniref:solute carrier family 2, facilitated glucose transporter member 1-like isoform X2 n=1 Tax=Coccinella septempunctata TaxID=41139 RepID=UPI001D07430F|nr:solute carrier family 2, facilitated glucose transporter member 1-like isoform X2 [Coccinella septempunctata]